MKAYSLACHCGRQEIHGLAPPVTDVQRCVTARAIRAGCKDVGCQFTVVECESELSDVDNLRLGLRGDVPVVEA
jgi:hypothetical protein